MNYRHSAASARPVFDFDGTEQRSRRRPAKSLVGAFAASLTLVASLDSHAASIAWFNAAGGDLTSPGNWFGGVAPGPADDAVFSIDSTISFFVPLGNGPVDYQSADFLRGTNSLALNDNTLTLSDGLIVADAGFTGSLTLTSGTIAANGFESVNIGNDAASVGATTIDSASLILEERVSVGNFGNGTLSVINGGTVSSQGGSGFGTITVGREVGSTGLVQVIGGGSSITVDDTNSALVVGRAGTGTMNVTGGGDVLAVNASIGSQATGVGDVLVSGNGSTLDVIAAGNATFSIGSSGTGTLTINNGADASSDGTDIGNLAGSTGTLIVAGVGSTYTDTADLIVGEEGNGTLRVENGGQVFADQFVVGEEAGSVGDVLIQTGGIVTATNTNITLIGNKGGTDGTVTVDGIGSLLDSSLATIGIGNTGTGRLNVTNGGGVTANAVVMAASSITADAAVLVDGAFSTLTITGELDMGPNSATPTPSSLTVSNGGSVTAAGAELGNAGASINVTGTGSQLILAGNIEGLASGPTAEGNLLVSNGGQITNQQSRWDGNSTLIVEDVGSTWTNNGNLRLEGVALTVRDGGTVNATSGAFDFDASGQSSLVTGAGSTLDLNGLFLGSGGSASLNVENGGSLITNFSTLADGQTDAGTLTVDGAGSSWTDGGDVVVGFDGTGTVNIRNSASAAVGNIYIAAFTGSNGTLSLDTGGQLTASDVSVGGDGFSAGGTGLLEIRGGATATVGDVIVHTDGELTVDGGTLQATNLDVSVGTFDFGDGLVVVDGGTLTAVPNLVFLAASGNRELRLDNAATSSLNSLSISDSAFTLDIRGGSSLSVANQMPISSGSVIVSDVGSTLDVVSLLGVGTSATGSLTINAGADVTADGIVVGSSFVAGDGAVNVDGVGSSLTSSGDIVLDGTTIGSVTVTGGATVTNTGSSTVILADQSGSTGSLVIDGAGSTWSMSGGLEVGRDGDGLLTVSNGGALSTAGAVTLATQSGTAADVNLNDTGSTWSIGGDLNVGQGGSASLTIVNGGSLTTIGTTTLAGSVGSSGIVSVGGAGSNWTTFGSIEVGDGSAGTVNVTNGGTLTSAASSTITFARSSGDSGFLNVTGAGSALTGFGFFDVGEGGFATATVSSGGVVSAIIELTIGRLGGSTGTITVDGSESVAAGGAGTNVGLLGSGSMYLVNGGALSTSNTYIGRGSGGSGILYVAGTDSTADAGQLIVGDSGSGQLDVRDGASVTSSIATLAREIGSSSNVDVDGAGSLLSSLAGMSVGGDSFSSGGTASLTIGNGGTVDVMDELKIWGTGTVDLNGGIINAGSVDAIGTLNFNAGALNVTNSDFTVETGGILGSSISLTSLKSLGVSGTTTLSGASTLSIDGGTFSTGSLVDNGGFAFNSGTFNLTNDDLTIGTGGLFGSIVQFGFGQTVNVTNNTTVDNGAVLLLANGSFSSGTTTNNGTISLDGVVSTLGGGVLSNNALVTGDGRVTAQLNNAAAGEVRAASGDTLTFTGAGNTNTGRINLLGGTVDFDGDLTNASGGVIAGRGTLIADGGLTNAGNIGLSSGNTDIFGDVDNVAGGAIIISGAGTATFFDDLIHNGAEIRVSAGSNAVFFGAVSGAGSYTGTGSLFFEGDLNPGNSPGLVSVAGDMNLGTTARTIIELAGLDRGAEYDAFDIGGDLQLGGELDVVLYDDGDGLFAAQEGDSFDLFMAESIFGDFDLMTLAVLSEGLGWQMNILTDEFGSMDVLRLDVVAAAVPVPAAVWLFGSALASLMWIRRRPQVRAA